MAGNRRGCLLWAATWKVGAGVLVVGLALALPRDRQRRRMRKYGRRTKGPELATAAQFNRANPSNGIGFLTKERRTLIEFLLQREGKMVRGAAGAGELALPDDRGYGCRQIVA